MSEESTSESNASDSDSNNDEVSRHSHVYNYYTIGPLLKSYAIILQDMEIQEHHYEPVGTSFIPIPTHTNQEPSITVESVPSSELTQTPSRQLAEFSDVTTPAYSPITPVGHSAATPSTDHTQATKVPTWQGFKLVGDNLDKTVRRRHQTHDAQTVSMHYFHYYGVLDRIDLSKFSDKAPEKPKEIDGNLFLPTLASIKAINHDFCTYVAR